VLLLASSVCGLFKWCQFEPEVILLAVGWSLRFSLSYRDVEELLAERGLHADHVTVWRWVQSYALELERRLRQKLRPINDSWRVDFDLHPGQGQVGVFIPRGGFHLEAKTGSDAEIDIEVGPGMESSSPYASCIPQYLLAVLATLRRVTCHGRVDPARCPTLSVNREQPRQPSVGQPGTRGKHEAIR
jgi:hypothetical protein